MIIQEQEIEPMARIVSEKHFELPVIEIKQANLLMNYYPRLMVPRHQEDEVLHKRFYILGRKSQPRLLVYMENDQGESWYTEGYILLVENQENTQYLSFRLMIQEYQGLNLYECNVHVWITYNNVSEYKELNEGVVKPKTPFSDRSWATHLTDQEVFNLIVDYRKQGLRWQKIGPQFLARKWFYVHRWILNYLKDNFDVYVKYRSDLQVRIEPLERLLENQMKIFLKEN